MTPTEWFLLLTAFGFVALALYCAYHLTGPLNDADAERWERARLDQIAAMPPQEKQ